MGKKGKIGKARKDKFYHLAKETGFRARSAFKLLQLNRKYEFLQKSRVCIDLCAAPGGWLQVAAQNMPVASVIIGVDLVPIKPIHNVKTFTEDITTDKCRQVLKKELHDWKADAVLNDGAPNVGKNWVHDAFAQAELTLSALKLATEFLRKGGWFVTKIFRSKDYQSLMWVFSQLFKKVFATKPQASRNESAEIFVVCQGFLAPDTLDPKFTDPKYVFQEVMGGEKKKDILNMKNKKAKAEGYGDDDTTLHYKLNASTLIAEDNHMELLATCNQIVLDQDRFANHPLTTDEIKEYMNDIKVLGKREIKLILKWRLKMRDYLKSLIPKPEGADVVEEEESEDEEAKIDETVAALREEEEKDAKKKRKQVLKEKRKLRDKMNLKMIIPGDEPLQTDEIDLFNLKKIKKKQQLDDLRLEPMAEGFSDEEDFEALPKKIAFDRHNDVTDPGIYSDEEMEDDGEDEDDIDDDDDGGGEDDDGDDDDEKAASDAEETPAPNNPLVVDLEEKDSAARRKAAMWFDKDAFSALDENQDEDLELEAAREEYKRKGGRVLDGKATNGKRKPADSDDEESDSDEESEEEEEEKPRKKQKTQEHGQDESESEEEESETDSDTSDSDDSEDEHDIHRTLKQKHAASGTAGGVKNNSKKDGFEVVPISKPGVKKIVKLSPVELAIGEELIKSSKRRREIIEGSFNRYAGHDENLPEWFLKDEQRHTHKQLPVTKEQIEAYKTQLMAINARPVKKVAEAKARKKRKSMKKLEKVRKKAEAISETQDVSDKEKWQQIRQIYSKAGLLKKKKETVAYVVAKRGTGRKVSRPAGIKGKFRVVDPRMKKDDRLRKTQEKSGRGKKGKGRKAGGGGGKRR